MAVSAIVSARHKVLAVPYRSNLANLVPDHKVLDHPDHGRLIVLPHKPDIVKLVRNLGLDAPAPILSHYDWNGDVPFMTQKATAAMLTMNNRAYVLSEMGTGKTRATLHAINYLKMSGEINKTIVVAPLSTLSHVWEREIFRYFPHLETSVLHGTREKRLKALERDVDIYIINHDGIHTVREHLWRRKDIDLVVIDELASFRNGRTRRWKSLNELVQGRKFAWGLTGSPTPNEPADAWGQVRLLTPNRVPKFFKMFKQLTMMQVSQFKWVPRNNAKRVVHKAMQPSVRFTRDECVELPPIINITRDVGLSPQQDKAYNSLVKKFYAEFKSGKITAANEGVKHSKLLQVATGYIYTNDGGVIALDNSDRVDALREVIEEAEGKVIVFVDFIHAAKQLHALVSKDVSAALVLGETARTERDKIFNLFQNSPKIRVLIAHPKCMAHGLTLTAANVIVWYSPTLSLETYEQATARVSRPGQTRKQLIVHLTGTPAESKVYSRLQKRASMQGALLELFEDQEEES